MVPIVWADGRLRAASEPVVEAGDPGLVRGLGAFETCPLRGGIPFALGRHLDRLEISLRGLGLSVPPRPEILAAVQEVLAAGAARTGGPTGVLRIVVTGGGSLVVTTGPGAGGSGPTRLVSLPWTRNPDTPTRGLKTLSYADHALGLAHARAAGGTEGLWSTVAGDLCEGTSSNVFVEVDGALLTPGPHTGCLAGVTRDLLTAWAREAGIPLEEAGPGRLPWARRATWEHVAISSSSRGLLPAASLDDRPLSPGPLTAALADLYERRAAQSPEP